MNLENTVLWKRRQPQRVTYFRTAFYIKYPEHSQIPRDLVHHCYRYRERDRRRSKGAELHMWLDTAKILKEISCGMLFCTPSSS